MLASSIIDAAQTLLNDEGVRWTRAECLAWLNSGQRQIVAVRPDAKTARTDVALIAGALQSIPAAGLRLLNVPRNKDGRAVTLVSSETLTAFNLSWYTSTPRGTVKHYMFDPRSPKEFEVYPPAVAGTLVQVLYSVLPTDCASEADSIDLDATYESPLVDWICYRGFSKDLESPDSAALAKMYLQSFTFGLTGKTQSDLAVSPGALEPNKLRPALK